MNVKQRGFTLLEVMVALAILALVLGTIISAGGASASHLGMLRQRTLAGWVAQNKINELLLTREWPETASKTGSTELGGWEWQWETRIVKTSDQNLRRLEVTVRAGKNSAPAVELIAFKARPPDLTAQAGSGNAPRNPTGDNANARRR